MRYLEDYLSEDRIDALDEELRKVYDNEEFVMGILAFLKNDQEADELLDFLRSNNIERSERYKIIHFQIEMEKRRT